MADFALAEAFVQIRPDVAGFRTETESKVKAALSGLNPEIKVKLTPDVSGFAAAVKAAIASAAGGKGATIPLKLNVEADAGDLARQIQLIKTKMVQQGLGDFLDINIPIGKIQYQISLLRRLLQQGKLTDFLGTSLQPGQVLAQGAALRTALQRELGNVNIGVGLSDADIAKKAAAAKAAAIAALGGPAVENVTAAATAVPGAGGGGGGTMSLLAQSAAARQDATALLALAAGSTKAGDAAKFAYAANIASNISMQEAAKLAAPVTNAVSRMAGGWWGLTNKVKLFGGALVAIPFLANIQLWHALADVIIETAAVLIPATIAFVAFGAAAAPTVQHIGVQMQNVWTTSNALNQSIYPLTKNFKSLGDAVKPEVYLLFGEALVVATSKAGEFSKIAAETGHVVDQLGARASAALVSGGLSTFLEKGPADVALLGSIVGNIFGIVGNLLKTMPDYAQKLFGVLNDVTHAIENLTASPIAQWVIHLGLQMHGAVLYTGLAATAFIFLGNSLVGLAAKFGLASGSATFFDAAMFGNGLRQMIGGTGLLAGELITLGASEDIAAAGSLLLEGALISLEAATPLLILTAIAAAAFFIYKAMTSATSATIDYDNAVKGALQNAPVSQTTVDITRATADTTNRLAEAYYHLGNTQKTVTELTGKSGTIQEQVVNPAYTHAQAVVAGYQAELGTLQGYQKNYNELVKAAGGNLALLSAAGITNNQILGASSSQMEQNIIMVQAEGDQFKAMALGTGRAGAAMNALNYTGDTTSNMLGSLDVDMQKIVTGQDALNTVILGGEQAFIGFQQAVQQWGTDLGVGTGQLQNLTGMTAAALTQQSDFYNTVLPGAQKVIDALEMQLAPTDQITTATADAAAEMLALAGNNKTMQAVVISTINNALGPGTVSFQNLNTWVKNNSGTQLGFQSIMAQSTINAAALGGTINQLTSNLFAQDLLLSAHVNPDIRAWTNAIVNNGAQSDAAQGARQKLINDLENAGLSAQAATQLVDTLQGRIDAMHGNNVNVGVSATGSGGIVINGTGMTPKEVVLTRLGMAAGGMVTGGIPGRDSVLVAAMPGEVIVPTRAVGALTPALSAAKIPGFQAGGIVGAASSAAGYDTGQLVSADVASAVSSMSQALQALAGFSPGGPASGAVFALEQYAASLFGGFGWSGDQILPLGALWNRESGWDRFARNPSSGAYGIAQALPPTKYPFAGQAAGGSDASAQIQWGEQYIAGRYGTPGGAWAHELSAGWYDTGGWLMPGASVAVNRTGKPEYVSPPGEGPMGSGVTSRLDTLISLMCAAPWANANALTSSLNGVSQNAITTAMYPNRIGAGR